MSFRIEHEATPDRVVITRQEYETDKKRGYCIVQWSPPREHVIKNPRNQSQEIRSSIPRTVLYCCMTCHFNVVEGEYAEGKKGIDKIKEHVWRNNHPWPYAAFRNPYGNVADVAIEGVEDYALEIAKEN